MTNENPLQTTTPEPMNATSVTEIRYYASLILIMIALVTGVFSVTLGYVVHLLFSFEDAVILYLLSVVMLWVALANMSRGVAFYSSQLVGAEPKWVLDDVNIDELVENGRVSVGVGE